MRCPRTVNGYQCDGSEGHEGGCHLGQVMLKDFAKRVDPRDVEIAALRAENERLRGALRAICAEAGKGDGVSHWEDCDARNCSVGECVCPEDPTDEGEKIHETTTCSCTVGMLYEIGKTASDALAPDVPVKPKK